MGITNKYSCILEYGGISYDCTDFVINSYIEYGKNQPFAHAHISLLKDVFFDESSWPGNAVPVLIDGRTKVSVQNYTDKAWGYVLESHETNDNILHLDCYNPMYKCKRIRLQDTLKVDTVNLNEIGYLISFKTKKEHAVNDRVYVQTTVKDISNPVRFDNPLNLEISGVAQHLTPFNVIGTLKLSGTNVIVDISYIMLPTKVWGADGWDFLAFARYCCGSYSPTEEELISIVPSSGVAYDVLNGNDFTSSQIDSSKAPENLISISHPRSGFEYAFRTDIRLIEIIRELCMAECMVPVFADKMYLINHLSKDSAMDNIILEYGGSEDILSLADNTSMGTNKVISAQSICGENYELKLNVADSITPTEGLQINTHYPDPESISSDNAGLYVDMRNKVHKAIAFNELASNSEPEPCISYAISEMSLSKKVDYFPILQPGEEARTYFKSLDELKACTAPKTEGNLALVEEIGYASEYFVFSNNNWMPVSLAMVRYEKYNINSVANISDIQNNVAIENAHIGLIRFSYPECITTLWWTNAFFEDVEQMMDELETKKENTGDRGTEDVTISNKYNAKIAVGNMPVELIPPSDPVSGNRDGFTGLIQEKNWDSEVYRLAGYKKGILQAQFNTEGEITAGGGSTILNEDGLTVLVDSNNTEYVRKQAVTMSDIDTSKVHRDYLRLYAVKGTSEGDGLLEDKITSVISTDVHESPIRIYNTPFKSFGDIEYNVFSVNEPCLKVGTPSVKSTTVISGSETVKSIFSFTTEKSIGFNAVSFTTPENVYNLWGGGSLAIISDGCEYNRHNENMIPEGYQSASVSFDLYSSEAPVLIDCTNAVLGFKMRAVKTNNTQNPNITAKIVCTYIVGGQGAKTVEINPTLPCVSESDLFEPLTAENIYSDSIIFNNIDSPVTILKFEVSFNGASYSPSGYAMSPYIQFGDVTFTAHTNPIGSEVQLWDTHTSLCGRTEFRGSIDGDFACTASASNSIYQAIRDKLNAGGGSTGGFSKTRVVGIRVDEWALVSEGTYIAHPAVIIDSPSNNFIFSYDESTYEECGLCEIEVTSVDVTYITIMARKHPNKEVFIKMCELSV